MKFVSIYKTRLRVLFSDRLFILAILIVPVLLSLITGYAQRKEKMGYVPVALVDEDQTSASASLCKRLAQKEGLKVTLLDKGKALAMLKGERAEVLVVIEKGFDRKLQENNLKGLLSLVKSPSTYSAELVKEIITAEALRIYSGDFALQWLANSFTARGRDISALIREELRSRAEAYWHPVPPMSVDYEEVKTMTKSPEGVSIPSFSAASLGLLVFFVMLAVLFGSGWLCEEKANGTLQRILSVRGAAVPLFLGNTAALMTLGFLQTTVFILVQRIFFRIEMLQGAFSWLVVIFYVLCASSLSMLLASLLESPHQLQAVAPVFALITGLMGGCLWNLLGVPEGLLKMALLTPQGWALQALTGLYAAPDQFSLAFPPILVLMGLSIVLLSLAYRLFRRSGRMAG